MIDTVPTIIQILISLVPALTLFLALRLSLIEQPVTYRGRDHKTVGDALGESARIKAIITSVFLFFQSVVVSVFAPDAFVYVFVLAIMMINFSAILCIVTDFGSANGLVADIHESRAVSTSQLLQKELDKFLASKGMDSSVLMRTSPEASVTHSKLSWFQYFGISLLTLFPVLSFSWIFLSFGDFGSDYIRQSGFEPIGGDIVDSILVFALSNYGIGTSCPEAACQEATASFIGVVESPTYKSVLFLYFWCITYPIVRFLFSLREYRSLLRTGNTDDLGLETDVVQKIGFVSAFLLSVLIALLLVDVPIGEIGLFSGIVAAALSLALRDTLGNLMAGALLIWDGSLKKGDVITIPQTDTNDTGSTYGIIQEMRMRYTIIEDRNTVRRLIPNSVLVTEPIESWTHENSKVRLSLNIGVGYETDLQKAKQIMESVCYDVSRVVTTKPPQALVVNFGDHSIDFSLRFWLRDTNAGIRPVISEVLMGIKKRFDEENIEIPFPQQDLWLRNAPILSEQRGTRPPSPKTENAR